MPDYYILKSRGRFQWTTVTIKGSRRVERWEPWRTISKHCRREQANDALALRRKNGGLEELAVFYGGKKQQ